jgi:polygalacturonase
MQYPMRHRVIVQGRFVSRLRLLMPGALSLLMLTRMVLAVTPAPPIINTNQIFDVTNTVFAGGALGNGVSNNATAIQAAISMASTSIVAGATGGTVRVRAVGTFTNYLCGPISLKNNVNLLIDSGTKLQMLPFGSYPTNPSPTDFISASNLHDIEISGLGTIDGQGAPWWAAFEASGIARPKAMFAPSNCKRVLVQDVTLQSPPNTHISLRSKCGDVNIQRITINTTSDVISDNTDGIDVNATNCLIQASFIYCGDDHIAIGGGSGDITVTNCTFGAGHGISIGSSTDNGGVHDLIVSNCTMTIPPDGSLSSGIRGKSARGQGGLVQRLTYVNITLTNVQNPIFISSYYPDSTIPSNPTTDPGSAITSTTPIWQNITISNVTTFASSGHNVGRLYGLPEMLISNITLSKVTATGALSFDMYNIQAIQFIDSQIIVPATTNTLNLYNVQIMITNSTLNTNLVRIGGWTSSRATNQLSAFNAKIAITDTNIFKNAKPTTLGNSTLSFTQSSASFYNDLNIVSASTLLFTRGTNTCSGALSGIGPLAVALTNNNIMAVVQGNTSGFTGTFALSGSGTLRLDQGTNAWGDAGAVFDSGVSGIINNHSSSSVTIFFGALSGTASSGLRGSDQTGPGLDIYVIGGLGSNTTFTGTIADGTSAIAPHTVAITEVGSGTFTLSGANTYSGGTTVSNGTLLVNNTIGSGTGVGAVTVVNGATLNGGGIIAGPVSVDGTLAPGNSPGTLTISNNLVVNGDAVLQYQLGTNSDLTVVSGNLNLGGTLNITDAGGFTNGMYTLFTYGGALTYNGVIIGTTPNANLSYTIDTNTVGLVNLDVNGLIALDPFVAWQLQYFGCTNCAQASPDADPLGKGMSNTNQFLAGLNPTNPASALQIISAVEQGSDISIIWTTAGSHTNAVQATLGDGNGGYATNFTDISSPIVITGNGDATTNYTDTGGGTNAPSRYYRIRLVP